MSDDFGTVNLSRADRAREVEVMRQQFRRHREALVNLAADAPTEHLAAEYRRLIQELDNSIHKVDELEGKPLVRTPEPPPMVEDEPRSRVAIIVVVAVIALALIGGLTWWASRDRAPEQEQTVVQETVATTETVAAPVPMLTVTPTSHDYGVIRKGTRATRQFEIANRSEEPVSIHRALDVPLSFLRARRGRAAEGKRNHYRDGRWRACGGGRSARDHSPNVEGKSDGWNILRHHRNHPVT